MNVIIWLTAGAVAGWIASSILNLNAARAVMVSAIIGVVGVVYGGEAIAPPFVRSIGSAGVLTPFAVLVTSVSAIACLKVIAILFALRHRYRSSARAQRTESYEVALAATTKVNMESLQDEINIELKKLGGEEQARVWLTSPQQLLGRKIPARMIAIGEGLAVLEALRRAQLPV